MANPFDEIDPRGGSRQTTSSTPAASSNPFDDLDPRGGAKKEEAPPPNNASGVYLSEPDASGRRFAAPAPRTSAPAARGIVQRAREGAGAPMEGELGFSQENRDRYPWLKALQPAARYLDVAARTPASIYGGLAGAAAGAAEKAIGPAQADRLQRDLGVLPMAVAPEVPIASSEASTLLRKPQPEVRVPPRAPPPLPPEVSAIPRQVPRPDVGVDLLRPDVPHDLPGPQSRALGAAGNGGPLTGMHPDTIAHMRQVMEEQGFNQNTIDQRLSEMSAHHFFGEITPSLEADMGAVASPPGPGKLEVMGSIRQRALEARERSQHVFNRGFGENENLPQMKRIMEIERNREADPLYQRFRETPISPTPAIDALLPRLEAAGVLQDANRALRIEGEPTARGFAIPGEPPTIQNVPTAGAFQLALEQISDRVGVAMRAGEPNVARRYTRLRNDLLAALDNHPNVGETWRQAREAYSRPAAIQDAIDLGRTVMTNSVSADELPFMTAGYNATLMRGLRVGIRDYYEQMLGKRGTLTQEVLNNALSPNNVQKMRWAIGDAATDQFVAAMEHEQHMHGAPARVHGGSPTALRMEANKRWTVQPEDAGMTLGDVAGAIRHPVRAAASAGVSTAEKFGVGRRRAANEARMARLREESSRIFTLQGPERDAVARHLVGGVGAQPYRHGGRVAPRERRSKLATGGSVRSKLAPRAFADGGEAEGDNADDMIERARERLATQPARRILPDVGEAAIGDGGQFSPGVRWANKAADVGGKLAAGMAHGVADLVQGPSKLSQPNPYPPGSEQWLWYEGQREEGMRSWSRGAALATMGTGAIAGVPVKGAEAVLGSGPIRRKGGIDVAEAAPAEARAVDGPGMGGPAGRDEGLRAAELQAERWAGERAPLEGLPRGAQEVDGELFVPGPVARAHDVAERYMADKEFGVPHPDRFHPIDKEHAKAIGQAFEDMKHAPNDPKVKAAYEALAQETKAQYEAIVEHGGLKVTPVNAADYPYHGNPRSVVKDVADNDHMAFFKSNEGFGSTPIDLVDQPMMRSSGIKVGDHDMLYNDLFRVVHDYFGHVKNGNGFRGAGEDNAWRAHAAMYSPEARGAMTTETRGQNSWLNYGPHGEHNRTANAADTIYAQQKVGLLPDWVMQDRVVAPAKPARAYYEGEPVTNAGVDAKPNRKIQTVADPHRMMFPGIYRNPRVLAEEAASRVGPEDPAMKQLFGVSRGDLREMAQGRVGNEEPKLSLADNPRGSLSAQNIQTPRNTQRLVDILGEAGKHEGLRTADAWYIMDPVYRRMVEMGSNNPAAQYRHFNTTMGMASPGSDVLSEIQRGTAAHWLHNQGRFDEFMKYAGLTGDAKNSLKVPRDVRYIGGHPYHRTSQGEPMQKYFDTGSIQSEAPKVPLYTHASGVPETGFQTSGPVGDAHFSRGVGLADTRKGPTDVGSSFSRPEYQTLQPWWQHDVAGKAGLESVPAQARLWTGLGPQTGVESELGAPKLELFAKQIAKAARRLGVSPETARDLILSGKAGAGVLAGATIAPRFMRSEDRPSRAEGGAVAPRALADGGGMTDDEAAMSPETFVPAPVRRWTEQAAPKDYALLRDAAVGAATLPQRAFEASEASRQGYGYDAGPIMEAAMLPMGTGAVAGVPVKGAEAVLGSGPIRAYHGSPHNFDQFDLSKVGSGEGQQVYGHGLYFADREGVAKSYRDNLQKTVSPHLLVEGERMTPARIESMKRSADPDDVWLAMEHGDRLLSRGRGTLDKFYGDLDAWTKRRDYWMARDAEYQAKPPVASTYGPEDFKRNIENAQMNIDRYSRAIPKLEHNPGGPSGRMYEVDLHADPEHMINWDAKFPQQSSYVQDRVAPVMEKSVADQHAAIERALARQRGESPPSGGDVYSRLGRALNNTEIERYEAALKKGVDDLNGQQIYKRMGIALDNHSEPRAFRAATAALRNREVPGLKYLDQGSRITGDAARIVENYGSREKALVVAQQRLRAASPGDLVYWDGIVKQLSHPETNNYVMFNDKLIDVRRKYAKGGKACAPRVAKR